MASSPIVQTAKLKGHQKEVLCLDHSSSLQAVDETTFSEAFSSGASLLSGSSDGTARLWDLREGNQRAAMCIQCKDEVLSVKFGPLCRNDVLETGIQYPTTPSNSCGLLARQFSVWLSVGSQIYTYDLRHAHMPILTEPSLVMNLQSQDEVNQIAFSNQSFRGQSTHIAAADDAGCIRFSDTIQEPLRNPKVAVHGSGSMVPCLAFRPRVKGLELAAGGTDCRVALYDLQRPKKALSFYKFTQYQASNQVCNPPMVHTLDFSPSGSLLAAGAGDGTIGIFGIDNRRLVLRAKIEDAHSGSIASVLFPAWIPAVNTQGDHAATSSDRLLASAGNDGKVVLWDLGNNVADQDSVDPFSLFPIDIGARESRTVTDGVRDISLESECTVEPTAMFAVHHNYKPNWMVSSHGLDTCYPAALFVADTSSEITVYNVPTL